MATLLERIRKQIKDRNIRTFGTINDTTEKKLKKAGVSKSDIQKLKKQAPEGSKTINEKELKKSTSTSKTKPESKSKSAPRAVDKGGRLSARGSEGYKPTNTKIGPNMSKVNKPDTPRAKKVDLKKRGPSGPTMTSMKAPSTGPKPRNKDPKVDLKKRGPSGPSMTGFKKGGKIDGCATRGLTRAKRSR
jgi:hypothetical protein